MQAAGELVPGLQAADAAVATAAALNVTEPTSTGLGGDCFALYYEAANGQMTALNGSGRAPGGLTLERLGREGWGNALPPYHPYTITVPGACAGWCDLLERYGRLPRSAVLAPAIRLAHEGFPVAPVTAYFWGRSEERLRASPNGIELTIQGHTPRAGELFHNPGLAKTLGRIAEGGKDAYYQGEIAEAISKVVQEAGGCLAIEDLAAHTSTWETPINVPYRGIRVWECPPNGQGLAALLALGFVWRPLRPLRGLLRRCLIRPRLAAGEIVLSDRYADSTLAYQGYGHGVDLSVLRQLLSFATGGLTPDLTLLFDVDVETGLSRRQAGGGEWNRLDDYELAFHRRVRDGYLELAAAEPQRWVRIDAAQTPQQVQLDLQKAVIERLVPRS